MTKDEALDLALEFFETMQRYKGVRSNIFIKFEPTATGDYFNLQEFDERAKPIITAIKQALADIKQDLTPVQEPVAIALNTGTKQGVKWLKNVEHGVSLYTTPPAAQRQWTGLDGFEQKELMAMSAREAVFATEAKLRSKNNG